MARNERSGTRAASRVRSRVLAGAAALLASLIMTAQAMAQATITVPGTSGDQLIYFYDARTDRVPFLTISNPAATPVVVEVAFYPANLASRLGEQVYTLPGGGNIVVDPTSSSVAGGAASGNAGLAIVTPIASTSDTQAVVPPQPLTGGYTLANLALGAAFGENPYGRLAVGSNGARAAAGAEVDGNAVKYQRFTPAVLMVPAYFNPQDLAPAAQDGNRVVIAAFNDVYGAAFGVTALGDDAAALFCDADGFEAAVGSAAVNGVLLSNLQEIAGSAVLSSSGKLFLDVDAGSGNVLGIFAQSLGTFAAGQRMPSVASIPDCPQRTSPTPTPTRTPGPTGNGSTCPASGKATATINVAFDNGGGAFNAAGVTTTLSYPGAVSIPGVGSDATVIERVTNLTGVSNGIFSAGDNDTNADNVDDQLSVGLITTSNAVAPGAFARVQFDCTAGAALGSVSCAADVTDAVGTDLSGSCSVAFGG